MDVSARAPGTLADILLRAATDGSRLGIGYIQEDGGSTRQTYPELLSAAARILTGLRARGLAPGDRVILALSRNQEFLAGFWGCVLGGMIPVPVAPPAVAHKPIPTSEKLVNVWRLLQRPWVVTDGDLPEEVDRCLPLSEVATGQPATSFHQARLEDTAFIQFSSGSTSAPKGVVLTHRNVLSNLAAITEGLQLQADDVTLNWLPLHHDMGFVGFHLTLVYCVIQQFHLESGAMVRQPLLWLDALERYRTTVTGTPNFGLTLVLTRLERAARRTWDLSSVRLILVGAEPISVETLERFSSRLKPFALDPKSLFPVYGLAEATVAVAFPTLGQEPQTAALDRLALQTNGRAVPAASGDRSAIRFAVEGFPLRGCEIRIVNDQDDPAPEGAVGHIQIQGQNVTAGYWQAPEANRESFCGSWLRTGDLGFLREGRLCVTGRSKDIIFLNGQNCYAHDLEAIAQQVPGVSARKLAVCGWHDPQAGREKLLLFLSSRTVESAASLCVAVKRHLQRVLGITVDVAVPLASKEFPRTTSGKLQRHRLRERFEQGEFARDIEEITRLIALHEATQRRQLEAAPESTTERLLHRIWCDELHLDPTAVGIHDRFDEVGGQSIQALAILTRVEQELGISIHSRVLTDHPTIAEQAAYLDRHAVSLQMAPGHKPRFFRG